ncbi:10112_t:CDS:2, partial [Gigaspora margarita]
MSRIHTLSDIGEGKKLGDIPSNRYPPSRTELENQLACANRDREIAIECGNRLVNKCSVLDKDNKRIQHDLKQSNKDKEKLSKHAYQLIEEVKRLRVDNTNLTSQITQSQISHNDEICSEVSDTEISRVKDPFQCNKNSTISPNETYSQISMGEVEAIPAVVGALGSPLIALLLL